MCKLLFAYMPRLIITKKNIVKYMYVYSFEISMQTPSIKNTLLKQVKISKFLCWAQSVNDRQYQFLVVISNLIDSITK